MTKRTLWTIVLTAVLAMAVAPASAAVYTVGTGGDYAGDWAGLQSAITAAAGGANEVHILGGVTIARPTGTTNLTRASGDANTVTISGGWSSDFSAQSGGATVIDAAGNGRNFDLLSPTIMKNLTITGGRVGAGDTYGVAVRAEAQVRLSYLTMIDNNTNGGLGGAVDFRNGAAGSVLEYSKIIDCYSSAGSTSTSNGGSAIYSHTSGASNDKIVIANCELVGSGSGINGTNAITIVNTLVAAGRGALSTGFDNQAQFKVVNSTLADVVPDFRMAQSNVYNYRWQMVNSIFSDGATGFYAGSSSSRDVNFAYSTIEDTTLYGGGTYHFEGPGGTDQSASPYANLAAAIANAGLPTSDPALANRPAFIDKPTATGTTISIAVADSSLYAVNGYVEVVQADGVGRGVARQIADIPDATHIVLAAGDALPSSSAWTDVISYWGGSTNVTGDYNLTAASTAQIDGGGRLLAMTAAEKLAVFGEAVSSTVLYLDLGGLSTATESNYNDGNYDALTDVIVDLGGYTPSAGWNLDANGFYTDWAYVTDLAGNARVVGGAIDMGAYEYAVPEPATLAFLAAGGLAMAAGAARRRKA